jgi:hypothetical protein
MADIARIIAGAACCGGMLLGLAVGWAMARMAGISERRDGL